MNLNSIRDALNAAMERDAPMGEIVASPKTVMLLLQEIGNNGWFRSGMDLAGVPHTNLVGSLYGMPIRTSLHVPDGELYIFDVGGGLRSLTPPAMPAFAPDPQNPYDRVAYIKQDTFEAMTENDEFLFQLDAEGAADLHATGIPYKV